MTLPQPIVTELTGDSAQAIAACMVAISEHRKLKATQPDAVTQYCDNQARAAGVFVSAEAVEDVLRLALETARYAQQFGMANMPGQKEVQRMTQECVNLALRIELVAPHLA